MSAPNDVHKTDGRATDIGVVRNEHVLESTGEYAVAQRTVDALADAGFPVEHVRIIGSDIRLVENVTGRMTTWRAALAGGATGAWFGLLIGFLLGLFAVTGAAWIGTILAGIVLGAFWGAVFGFVAHAMQRGKRDFSSSSRLDAGRYEVCVAAERADGARRALGLR